jgi:hypothetical protein
VTLTGNDATTLLPKYSVSGGYAIDATGTTCGTQLGAKQACTIAVTFTPPSEGVIDGAVSITDGTQYSPQLVALTGTGSGGSTAPLTFTPSSLSLSAVQDTTSAAKAVTVKNTSASALTLSSIATSGEFAATGSGTTPCKAGLVLNASSTCTLSVTFSPALGPTGSLTGSVAFTDTATVGQQVLNLKGTAVYSLTFAPTSLSFAAQTVATSSAPQTVTMTNNLAVSAVPNILGNGDFVAVPGGATPCSTTLAPHASCTFTVTFTPSAVGTRASAVTVQYSQGSPGYQTLSVTGTGQ